MIPPGYVAAGVGGTRLVAREEVADSLLRILRERTLHEDAGARPERRTFTGRAPAYAVTLDDPARTRVVVRHSTHGGMLAGLTGDRFLVPTRAPLELAISLRLADLGVPTPELLAYAVYPAGPLLRRADVVTREVEGARDLATALGTTADAAARQPLWEATRRLVHALQRAGAVHPDLNLKNVLVTGDGARCHALVLDVDVVRFASPGDPLVTRRNVARLVRSARKWRAQRGLHVADDELARLTDP